MLFRSVRATGRIGVVGVYNPQDPGAATEGAQQGRYGFNYGLVFDKAISMGQGQCPVKRYNHQLRDLIIRGKARPSLIVSHEPQITGLLHVLADEHLRQYFYLARIRLALFLLSEHAGEDDGVLVGARLSDAAVVQDPGLDREFFLLARRHCAAVGGRDRERLLALIDRGPSPRNSSSAGSGMGRRCPLRKRGPGSAGGSVTGSRRSSPCSRLSGSPTTVTSWPSSARPPSSPRPCPPSGTSPSAARCPSATSRRPQPRTW